MQRLLLLTLTCVLFVCSPASAQKQSTPEYTREFQRGIDALTAGKNAEGIQIFEKLFADNPTDATSAYNTACGYSKENQVDKAFEWLNKAVDLGFGQQPTPNPYDNIALAEKEDPDLANMRSDPRFAVVIEKMKSMKKAVDAYVAEPAIYIPPALQDVAEKPLLIVLHDAGETKASVVAGPWKAVADQLGLALLAPSGRFPTQSSPSDGMRWIDNPQTYLTRNWTYEKPVETALTAFKKTYKYDRSKVFIAGEGEGATLALTMAIASPGLYKGVVAYNGQLVERLVAAKAPNAAKMGLRIVVLMPRGTIEIPGAQPIDNEQLAKTFDEKIKAWGIAGSAEVCEPLGEDAGKTAAVFVGALRPLVEAAAKPVEAGTSK